MKIIVLFKTHLDIGFTDFAGNVAHKYTEQYIPQAIEVAEEIARSGRPEGFIWTVGSWLVANYLETAEESQCERLCEALRNGWISWHALPCTMHSELCSAELYEYGLSLSDELGRRFGRETLGAKYTDVPGHTAAIIPHLTAHGVRFLHVGVNPASTPVDVPAVFRWRFAGEEICVMYNGDYGEFTQIPGTETYVYFAHTGDNHGPQSAEAVFAVFDDLHSRYPQAEIAAGDLNAVARAVLEARDHLPVIEGEMGDTWIHGSASDPEKTTQYRSLLRHCATLPETERRAAYRHLLLVPEHTWGMDEKTHLRENKNYVRPLFDRARSKYNFKKIELSWAEQRKYVLDAAAALTDPEAAQAALHAHRADFPDFSALTPVDGLTAEVNGMRVSFSQSGAVTALQYAPAGLGLTGCDLFGFSYDEYSADEVWAFQESYTVGGHLEEYRKTGYLNWAIEDFGKNGLREERNQHTAFVPSGCTLYRDENTLYALLTMDHALTRCNGLPEACMLCLTPRESDVLADFRWLQKPANRAPEALWLSFHPGSTLLGISKLGYLINPATVLPHGGKGLHGTDGKVVFDGVTVDSQDAVLVSVGRKNVFRFETGTPDLNKGVYFCLFNNQWGTNFPMWNEGDSRFRFVLSAHA